MTYRTGNHWGVTIVREDTEQHLNDDCYCSGDYIDPCCADLRKKGPEAQLVAVVVNGDQALAERICALLNGEPRCMEPTCPDYGDRDFGEATCPAEHADPQPAARIRPVSAGPGPGGAIPHPGGVQGGTAGGGVR